MNKLALFLSVFLLMSCAIQTNAPQRLTTQEKLYAAMEQQLPKILNDTGLMMMFVHNKMNLKAYDKDYPKINTTSSEFAVCMQTAIDKKFYEQPLFNATKSYLTEVSPANLDHDMKILTDKDFMAISMLFKDVFKLYASNQSTEQKRQIYQQLTQQAQQHNQNIDNKYAQGNNPLLSSTFDKYLGINHQKNQWTDAITGQIIQCIPQQLRNKI